MAKPGVLIRKYPDRRLYDTHASRYVTLEDIARFVRAGREVHVVEAKNGRDITPVILAQIIMEDARERETALPIQLLQQLVRASDRTAHDFISWYLNNAFDLYQKVQDTARTRLPDARTALTKPLDFVRELLGGQPPEGDPAAELVRLRRRVKQLESRLAGKTPPSRRSTPKGRPRARKA